MKDALHKRYSYEVHITPDDFSKILINSSTEDNHFNLFEYPTLEQVIKAISENNLFLEVTRRDGRLSGTRVKYYLVEFSKNLSLLDLIFLIDRDDRMNPKGIYYVRDGMHRLVAYGLISQMRKEYFPINGYYSTDRKVSI